MSATDPTILLDTASRKPAYLLKAEALMAEIHRGRFRPCDWLPGYRALAEQLGVSRTTALAAYGELPLGGEWRRRRARGAWSSWTIRVRSPRPA